MTSDETLISFRLSFRLSTQRAFLAENFHHDVTSGFLSRTSFESRAELHNIFQEATEHSRNINKPLETVLITKTPKLTEIFLLVWKMIISLLSSLCDTCSYFWTLALLFLLLCIVLATIKLHLRPYSTDFGTTFMFLPTNSDDANFLLLEVENFFWSSMRFEFKMAVEKLVQQLMIRRPAD